MQYYRIKQAQGVTLLELLLVLVIASTIIFLAINRYQLYRREKDIEAVKQNVNTLFQASFRYYQTCCSAKNGTSSEEICKAPSACGECPEGVFCINTCILENFLKKQNEINNLNELILNNAIAPDKNSYQVQATFVGKTSGETPKPIYQLSVAVSLPSTWDVSIINLYQRIMNASRMSSNTLYWDKMPSYAIPTTASQLWISDTGLRQFKLTQAVSDDDSCAY